jgi:hypothetical protein
VSLNSKHIKSRSAGIASLGSFLANPENVVKLSDKNYLELIQSLALTIVKDRKTHIQIASAERLAEYGDLVRKLVEFGHKAFKIKTVRYVLSHIQTSLSTTALVTTLIPSLVTPLSRALFFLCQYTAHVEHLTSAEWRQITVYCAQCISAITASCIDDDNKVKCRLPQSGTDMLATLENLLSNETMMDYRVLSEVVPHLSYFLDVFKDETSGHVHTFACLNVAVRELQFQDSLLCHKTAQSGILAVIGLRTCRNMALKEQIYSFLLHALRSFELATSGDNGVVVTFEALLNSIADDRQDVNSRISLDDVVFTEGTRVSWFVHPYFRASEGASLVGWMSALAMYKTAVLLSRLKGHDLSTQLISSEPGMCAQGNILFGL